MLNENLKKLMLELDIKVPELAKKTGVKAPVLYKIISGETPNPSIFNISPIANFFNVSIDQLIGKSPILKRENTASSKRIIPLINWEDVASWEHTYATKKRDKTVSIDFQPGHKTFALLVETDEFFPTFPEETTLIIDPETYPSHKSYALVCSDKGAVNLRQIFFDNDSIYLKPIVEHIPASQIKKTEKLYGTVLEAKIKFNKRNR